MPRKGYSSITLPSELYGALRERAKLYGTTPQELLKSMVFDGTFPKSSPAEPEVLGSNPSGPTTFYGRIPFFH
jgi:hypothetical protein